MSDKIPDSGGTPESAPHRTGESLSYQNAPQNAHAGATFLFWGGLYTIGIVIATFAFAAVGRLTPAAMLMQGATLVWAAVLILHVRGHRYRFLVAGLALLLPWLAVAYVIGWTLWHLVRMLYQGSDLFDPDHPMGLPAFCMFELLVFVPLSIPLLVLVTSKPWRATPYNGTLKRD